MSTPSARGVPAPPNAVCPGLPLSRGQVVDAYFIEHRARILDIAAFLDRVDRAAPAAGESVGDDFRMGAFRRALALLGEGTPQRARRVLELLSDPSSTPIEAAHTKGATGAFDAAGGSTRGGTATPPASPSR